MHTHETISLEPGDRIIVNINQRLGGPVIQLCEPSGRPRKAILIKDLDEARLWLSALAEVERQLGGGIQPASAIRM